MDEITSDKIMKKNILELNHEEFDNPIIKNKFIASTYGEWLGFVDGLATNGEEIEKIMLENSFLLDYEIILFSENCPDGEVDLLDMLISPQAVIYAFCVRRELLVKTGAFNELITEGGNYEFLLRMAAFGRMYNISCKMENTFLFSPFTMAYIMRRYMDYLKEANCLDTVFLSVVKLAEGCGMASQFNQEMNLFLSDSQKYDKIAENTAPCLIFVGDNTCSGVLKGFSLALADELANLGQAVITTDGTYGEYSELSSQQLLSQVYKAVIGFQSLVFSQTLFHRLKGKKIQFWFDDPVFFRDMFLKYEKDTYILCQDAYYADFINRYYELPNSIQFPPGGTIVEGLAREKIYDISFVGSYEIWQECVYEDAFENGFFNYMIQHSDCTFEQGMKAYLQLQGMNCEAESILNSLDRVRAICRDIQNRERHYLIEKIVSNGIKLHVFGESWKGYLGKGAENLVIHPEVFGEEPYHIWAQSKIGFNIMRGHKAGMTERIANIMLCGTCCLSDETVYLREHFTDGEDIVLFGRKNPDELPQKIRFLLANDEKRERIATAGYEKAMKEHTWRVRTEQLLEILNA